MAALLPLMQVHHVNGASHPKCKDSINVDFFTSPKRQLDDDLSANASMITVLDLAFACNSMAKTFPKVQEGAVMVFRQDDLGDSALFALLIILPCPGGELLRINLAQAASDAFLITLE
jgi:hypothetical protein